jgi:hypothetical protein
MKPACGLGCTTRKAPGLTGRPAKPGCQDAGRYSDADTGPHCGTRRPYAGRASTLSSTPASAASPAPEKLDVLDPDARPALHDA